MRRAARLSSGTRYRAAMVAVLVAGAVLRLWHLGDIPPGFQFDEAHNAIDAARVLAGELRLFFPDNGGREPLVTYLHATTLGGLGRENVVLALRLVSALVGIATIAVISGFGARFFRDRRVGWLAAGFLAVNFWHVHFSRYAIRAILAPMWSIAALWAWWIAVPPLASATPSHGGSHSARGLRVGPAILCGLFLAAAVYSHPSGRLLPIVLVAHAIARTVGKGRAAAAEWRALAIAGITAFVAFLPLGLYFLDHPGQFTAHPSDVSLAAVARAEHGGSLAGALASNAAALGGMLFLSGDPSTLHNLPGLPVFDPLSALFAVIGIGVVAGWLLGPRREMRDRALLLLLWLSVGLLPTLLSDRPPNYSRAMAALPVIVTLPAIGLAWAVGRARPLARPAGSLAAAVVLAAAGLWTAYQHLVAFPRLPEVFYSYDLDKVEAFDALDALADEATVFLHPLWAEQATLAFLDEANRLRPLDGRDTLVVRPGGPDTAVAFPAKEAQREEWYDTAKTLYGDVAVRTRVTDTMGSTLLRVLRVPPEAVGDMVPPRDAPLEPEAFDGSAFGGAIELVGYTLGEAAPGEPLPVILAWRSLAAVERDLTVFVHLVGPDGRALGQDDREPAHATYPTSRWRPGEVVIDRFTPELIADAPGSLSVVVGWYDRSTGRRLETADGRDAITLGPLDVGAAPSAGGGGP